MGGLLLCDTIENAIVVLSIKGYLSKLVVFPRKGGKAKKGFGGMPNDTLLKDVQDKILKGVSIEAVMPLPKQETTVTFRAPTEAERNSNIYETLKAARKPPKAEKEE